MKREASAAAGKAVDAVKQEIAEADTTIENARLRKARAEKSALTETDTSKVEKLEQKIDALDELIDTTTEHRESLTAKVESLTAVATNAVLATELTEKLASE